MARAYVRIDSKNYDILDGVANYTVIDKDMTPETLQEGPGGVTSPTKESSVTWAGFHQGTGQMVYDASRPYRYKRARDVDNRFPGFSFLCGLRQTDSGVTTAPTKIMQWNGNVYMAAGRYLFRLSHASGAAQVLDVGAGNTITDIVDASTTSAALRIVACVATDQFYHSATGASGAWTQSDRATADGGRPRYGLMIRNTLYFFYRPNEMRSAGTSSTISVVNISAGGTAFGAITYIGSATANINGVANYRERLLVKKDDTYYSVDQAAAVYQVFGGFAGQIDTAEAVHTEWAGDGLFYFKWGSKLFTYDGQDILTSMSASPRLQGAGPESGTSVNEDISCEVTALLSTERWLWAAVRSSVATPEYWLMCRGQVEPGGVSVWHDMNGLATNACNALGWLALSGTNNPRLYVGYGTGLQYIVQPLTEFPPDDPNYPFAAHGSMFLPDHHGRAASWRKNYYAIYGSALYLSNTNGSYIDVQYVLDHSGNPQDTAVGRFLDDNPLRFPLDTKGRHIELHLDLYTSVNTVTPNLLTLTMEYDHEPATQLYHQFSIILGPAMASGRSPRTRYANLLDLRQRGGQVAFQDGLLRDTWQAKMVHLGNAQTGQGEIVRRKFDVLPCTMKLYRAQRMARTYYGTSKYGSVKYV